MRGILTIDESKKKYIDSFFNAYWLSNSDLSDEVEISRILKSIEINPDKFF